MDDEFDAEDRSTYRLLAIFQRINLKRLALIVGVLYLVASSILSLVILRIGRLLTRPKPPKTSRPRGKDGRRGHVLVVLGSGGHTAEMLNMLENVGVGLLDRFSRRTYVVSGGDSFSAEKAVAFERRLAYQLQPKKQKVMGTLKIEEQFLVERAMQRIELARATGKTNVNLSRGEAEALEHLQKAEQAARGTPEGSTGMIEVSDLRDEETEESCGTYNILTVHRARNVHQPLLTTPFSALLCLWDCLTVLRGTHGDSQSTLYTASAKTAPIYPDIILTNGPGTGVCVVLAAFILLFFGFGGPGRSSASHPNEGERGQMRTVYIESFARVKTLSLSGKILKWCVDRFLVQWEKLKEIEESKMGGGLDVKIGKVEYVGCLVT